MYFENLGVSLTDDPEFRRKIGATGFKSEDDTDDTCPKQDI